MDELNGKARVRAAAMLGWARGLQAVGWNSRPGEEYICFHESGENAKPDALKSDLIAEGWNAWPDTHKDGTMEFSLYPVPVRKPALPGAVPEKISFAGADCQYPMLWICAALLGMMLSVAQGIHPFALTASAIIPGLLSYPFFYLRLETFDDHFTFRKNPFSSTRSVPYSDIARVRIIAVPIGKTGHSSWHFVFVVLKSGQMLRIYLPETRQQSFVALLNTRLS